jgi:sugar lactone lactonase YvrE
MEPEGSFHLLESETGQIPNGMGFSPDLSYFYFAVSDHQKVYRYDYDQKTGSIFNRTVLIDKIWADGVLLEEVIRGMKFVDGIKELAV